MRRLTRCAAKRDEMWQGATSYRRLGAQRVTRLPKPCAIEIAFGWSVYSQNTYDVCFAADSGHESRDARCLLSAVSSTGRRNTF
jgi:hypothetical protein